MVYSCWANEPKLRPHFCDLVTGLSALLTSVAEYCDLGTSQEPEYTPMSPIEPEYTPMYTITTACKEPGYTPLDKSTVRKEPEYTPMKPIEPEYTPMNPIDVTRTYI